MRRFVYKCLIFFNAISFGASKFVFEVECRFFQLMLNFCVLKFE